MKFAVIVAFLLCCPGWAETQHLRLESGEETDVPAAFIYDPLTKVSEKNQKSRRFSAGDPDAAISAPKLTGSFSLEAFVKPLGAADETFVRLRSTSAQGGEAGLRLYHLHAHNQFYFRGFVSAKGGPRHEPPVGYYGSSAQYQGGKDKAWRHMAVVYDAENATVTAYVDYHLAGSESVPKPVTMDQAVTELGGGKFTGLLDEVRLTERVLRPAEFLRAVAQPLRDVSFLSKQTIAPEDAGCLDVREHFGAVGDGVADDTAAFNRAFEALCSRVPLAYHTLLVPEGTYLISGVVQGGRFIDVKGAGPDRTVLKLKDGVFTDPKNPQPILRMSSTKGAPGSHKWVNGSSISIYVDGLTLDTGRGNPGARGIEFHANNLGRLENVVIRSGDGAGVCGLDLTHHDCGPALVKNVEITGFDYGIQSRYQEYSMTFEHTKLRGQRVAGVWNEGNILAIRGLVSENLVPAIVSKGANSMVTLLDSQLNGGASTATAIKADGALYLLRVKTSGYSKAVERRVLVSQKPDVWRDDQVAGPGIEEYAGEPIVNGFGKAKGALKLPIAETPIPPAVPVSEWVNAAKFADKKNGSDWSPAVQAAIDSGARVVYFPSNERMEFHSPIRVHGKVERLIGFGGELRWSKAVWKDSGRREQLDSAGAPPPLLIFDEPDPARIVFIERLGCVHVKHASRATLVLLSSSPDRYTTSVSGGKLFAEDVGGADWHFDHPQQVWVRQWNPESHAAGPCIHSKGSTIWALGFKTEYESQKLLAEAGAATEILGSFIYPIGKIPEERPIFENRDSRIALVYGTSVYSANHKLQIRDTRGTEVMRIGNDALKWAGSRGRMDLYVSEP